MSALTILLLFLAVVVYGVASGFARAWWRDRHPMELTLVRTEREGERPTVVLTSPRPVSREEHKILQAAAEAAMRSAVSPLAIDLVTPQTWRFGDPLPDPEPRP